MFKKQEQKTLVTMENDLVTFEGHITEETVEIFMDSEDDMIENIGMPEYDNKEMNKFVKEGVKKEVSSRKKVGEHVSPKQEEKIKQDLTEQFLEENSKLPEINIKDMNNKEKTKALKIYDSLLKKDGESKHDVKEIREAFAGPYALKYERTIVLDVLDAVEELIESNTPSGSR